MPYDPGPRRKVKAADMLAALTAARRTWQPEPSWAEVLATLAEYSLADWRQLSVAAGHPDRTPSPETRAQVLAAVQPLADADLAAAMRGQG
jgi:hypothetical protein